ncbi:MAG TPA: PP2C family serine/threonine-protein phosphatase, partial [Ktedonobacteraceae bacterium]|nr:PP2C family serine/threonine-protein phosphatase [Ktedonobacteraceae bacterium]
MSQTESGWLHHRRGAFHKTLHGEVRTLQSLLSNSITSDERLPFEIVGYSLPCEIHPQRNEDSFLIQARTGLIAVYDGVGGSVAGDIASQAAKRATISGWKSALRQIHKRSNVQRFLKDCERVDLCTLLRHLIELADETIRTDGVREAGTDDLATTVAIAALCHQPGKNEFNMVYAHVGDSRVYLLKGSEPLKRLTIDDGLLGKLIENEIVNEEDARRIDQAMRTEDLSEAELSYFRLRGGITQALGGPLPPEIHVDEIPISIGDRILLCTDGIHDNLTDLEIEDILRKAP